MTGNGLTGPVAIYSTGKAWVANSGGSTVSTFTSAGAAGTTYTVASQPSALAFDASGNLFVANQGSNSITELERQRCDRPDPHRRRVRAARARRQP